MIFYIHICAVIQAHGVTGCLFNSSELLNNTICHLRDWIFDSYSAKCISEIWWKIFSLFGKSWRRHYSQIKWLLWYFLHQRGAYHVLLHPANIENWQLSCNLFWKDSCENKHTGNDFYSISLQDTLSSQFHPVWQHFCCRCWSAVSHLMYDTKQFHWESNYSSAP